LEEGNLIFIDEKLGTDFISHDPLAGQPSGIEEIRWAVIIKKYY
jgi:hypothetical protein